MHTPASANLPSTPTPHHYLPPPTTPHRCHDKSINHHRIAAGPLGTAYSALVIFVDTPPRSHSDPPLSSHDTSLKFHHSSSRAVGNCLILTCRRYPPPNPTPPRPPRNPPITTQVQPHEHQRGRWEPHASSCRPATATNQATLEVTIPSLRASLSSD
jgi:hypothetical protein